VQRIARNEDHSGEEAQGDGKFRDELLNGEIFYTLKGVQVLIERCRHEYNTFKFNMIEKMMNIGAQRWVSQCTTLVIRSKKMQDSRNKWIRLQSA
jgi:hypothetical protein